MDVSVLLQDLFSRVAAHVHEAVAGLSVDQLLAAPEPEANSIAWLVWHLTRVQDDHIAEIIREPQIWMTEPWPARFGLRADAHDTGYGHSPEQVAAVRPDSADALLGYYAAVAARTNELIAELKPADLDRIVDIRWDPPVTLGVRLVSIADDDIQHGGQAAYVRGLLERR